jgi:transmembrane sensor
MADIHRIPSREVLEREASVWFARMIADDVCVDDRTRFEIWLRAHPAHSRAYADVCTTWQELEKLGPLVRAVHFGQTMNAAATPPPRRHRWTVAAVAAGLLLIAAGLAWNLYVKWNESAFQTVTGEQTTVRLSDGSTFTLNSNSRAQVEYTRRSRVVYLERGEAFFEVVHNPDRPLWVHAGKSWVRDIGTAFNVYLGPNGVAVTVSEGIVNVFHTSSDDHPPSNDANIRSGASVTAGEQLSVQGRTETLHVLDAAQIKRLLAWRTSILPTR